LARFNDAKNIYWDNRFKRQTVKLLPGEFHTSTNGEMIVTVLGSCVAACIRDKSTGIGGMNHFLLPIQASSTQSTPWPESYLNDDARYGDLAMELLINDIIKRGGRRQYLEAKFFGGAQMFESSLEIGQRNVAFVREYLTFESISIRSHDVNGRYGRKVYFIPETGDVYVKRINNLHNSTIEERERKYLRDAQKERKDATINFLN